MASSSRVAELPTSPAFFKVMIDDFRTQLRIPPAFSCELEGEKMGNVVLTSYKGSWEVEVGKCGERFLLRKGWTEFADSHSLVEGDFVVFQHNGNLRFDCVVFGRSACEKRLSRSGYKRGTTVKQEEVESDSKIPSPMVPANSFGNHGRQPEAAPPPPPQVSSPNTSTGRPSFTATITPSNSSRTHPYMASSVPAKFWRANDIIVQERSILLRDPLKRCWPVDLQYYPGIPRLNLGQGWCEFFEGNKLKVGDVCIFELNPKSPDTPNTVLDVHILPL